MTAAAVDAAATRPAPADRRPGRLRRNLGLVVTPVIVVVGLVAVLVYTATRELSPEERGALDAGYLWDKFLQHIALTAASTILVVAIALPLGIALSRPGARRVRPAVLAVGGFLQALPAYGVIVLLAFLLDFGFSTAVLALVLASFLPVLTNTVVGLRQVDPSLIEAARGMGMSARSTLLRVELPLAVPVVVAGVRVALVLNVGTATLATFIGAGGLGEPISSMITLGRPEAAFTASALVASLALAIDWLAGLAERLVSGRAT